MFKKFSAIKKLAATSFIAALVALTFSYREAISQAFPFYPIVGGASYSCGSVNAVQVCTVPAGPTAVTGAETIPADTNLANGSNPQTVKLSMRSLNAAPVTFVTCAAAACGTTTLGTNSGGVMLAYSTTIDSATVVLPVSPMDGQRALIGADHTVTSLTVTAPASTSLSVTTPTVLTASTTAPQGYEFIYVASTTKWYRTR